MKIPSKLIPLIACLAALGGCPKPAVYNNESFAVADSPFQLKVDDDLPIACESARRSLLGQGYLIEKPGDDAVKGRKGYKSSGNLSTFIEMNVTCVSDYKGSTLYANGVLSTYDLKKSSSAASVGLSAVGSISLPIGQSADSMVKVAEETINDKDFYGRFFAAVDYTLHDLRKRRTPEEPIPPAQPAPAIPIEQGPVVTASTPQAVPEAVAPQVLPGQTPPPVAVSSASEAVPDSSASPPVPAPGEQPLAPEQGEQPLVPGQATPGQAAVPVVTMPAAPIDSGVQPAVLAQPQPAATVQSEPVSAQVSEPAAMPSTEQPAPPTTEQPAPPTTEQPVLPTTEQPPAPMTEQPAPPAIEPAVAGSIAGEAVAPAATTAESIDPQPGGADAAASPARVEAPVMTVTVPEPASGDSTQAPALVPAATEPAAAEAAPAKKSKAKKEPAAAPATASEVPAAGDPPVTQEPGVAPAQDTPAPATEPAFTPGATPTSS